MNNKSMLYLVGGGLLAYLLIPKEVKQQFLPFLPSGNGGGDSTSIDLSGLLGGGLLPTGNTAIPAASGFDLSGLFSGLGDILGKLPIPGVDPIKDVIDTTNDINNTKDFVLGIKETVEKFINDGQSAIDKAIDEAKNRFDDSSKEKNATHPDNANGNVSVVEYPDIDTIYSQVMHQLGVNQKKSEITQKAFEAAESALDDAYRAQAKADEYQNTTLKWLPGKLTNQEWFGGMSTTEKIGSVFSRKLPEWKEQEIRESKTLGEKIKVSETTTMIHIPGF